MVFNRIFLHMGIRDKKKALFVTESSKNAKKAPGATREFKLLSLFV